jgi:hypothetical protein
VWYNYQKILDGKMTYLDNTGWIEQMSDERENAQKMKQMLGIKEGLDGYVPESQNPDEQIYVVTAEYRGGFCSFIGLATGNVEDIRAHFNKGYPLSITPIKIINVKSGLAEKKRELLTKQEQLNIELEQIRQELKDLK